MDIYRVSFFGHRVVEDALRIEKKLEMLIGELLLQHDYVELLVGRDGEFDQMVSSVIRRSKRRIRGDNSAHIWIMPYLSAEYQQNEQAYQEYYDEIIVCESSAKAYFKRAYQIRNQEIVDRSDLVVFCVQQKRGGAWKTMQYAKKIGVPIKNIIDDW